MASNEASQAHTHDSTRPAKAASDSNHGVPNQYTHSQINFTRGHASWEKGKVLLAQKKWIACLFIRDVFNGCSILIARNQ